MKILAATMPTKPAAIHSMVSMKRSIDARFMSAPNGWRLKGDATAGESRRRTDMCQVLLRQSVRFGEGGAKFSHRCVRIGPGFLDAITPGLDQRLGRLLPQRRLL